MLGFLALTITAVLCLPASDGNPHVASGNGLFRTLSNYSYTTYHPMQEISSWMDMLVRDNPDVVFSENYGQTFEGRNITLLKIGLNSSSEKKIIWMDCGIHAREWIAPAFCQWFVKEILRTYRTDEKINAMLKDMDFYVTPVLNVDGYVFSWLNQSTRLWRKSRSTPPDGCDCYGVDLNRNFYANWGMIGVSRNCCSSMYCGLSPVSEKEAQAVMNLMNTLKNRIICYLTIHSHGQLILVPYGYPEIRAPNYEELMQVGLDAAKAMKSAHGMNYTVGTSPDVLYANSGSSRDWARLIGIPFSFTFELRDKGEFGFELPEDQIQPTCEEAYEGARHIITYVHDKTFSGTTGTAVSAVAFWASVLMSCLISTVLL